MWAWGTNFMKNFFLVMCQEMKLIRFNPHQEVNILFTMVNKSRNFARGCVSD